MTPTIRNTAILAKIVGSHVTKNIFLSPAYANAISNALLTGAHLARFLERLRN
jgi:hypothetical protein